MAFPIIPKKRSGATGSPTSLTVGELAVNTATGELFLGGDESVLLLNPPTAAGTTTTEHTGDGTAVAFTFSGYNGTADGGYLVSVGGIDQPPSKYSVSSTAGGTITFVEAPTAGELISIRALVASSGGGGGDATSIQGRPVVDQVPDEGMALTWVGTNWQPSYNTNLGGSPLVFPFEPTTGNLLRFNGTNWVPFDGLAVPNWRADQTYTLGDIVYHQGRFYTSPMVSNTGNNPRTSGYWNESTADNYDNTLAVPPTNFAGVFKMQINGAEVLIPYFNS